MITSWTLPWLPVTVEPVPELEPVPVLLEGVAVVSGMAVAVLAPAEGVLVLMLLPVPVPAACPLMMTVALRSLLASITPVIGLAPGVAVAVSVGVVALPAEGVLVLLELEDAGVLVGAGVAVSFPPPTQCGMMLVSQSWEG
jgi:hypothetical protein